MLAKANRVSSSGIEKLFKTGRFASSPNLSFRFSIENSRRKRVAFIVPKALAKSAVKRNALRRRGYRAVKKYMNNIPNGLVGAFIFKKELTPEELDNEIKIILDKIN